MSSNPVTSGIDGASRMSSVSGLKVRPSTAMVLPRRLPIPLIPDFFNQIIEVSGRSTMTKAELVDAIDKASKLYFYRQLGQTLGDGNRIESVYMPMGERTSVCLSSQAGCAMGCTFCATGRLGLIRNLEPWEIVAQFVAVRDEARIAELEQEGPAAAEEARMKAAAEEERKKIVESAGQEIVAAAKAARRELKAYAADLAVSLAQKQIFVDTSTDQALVRSFADQLSSVDDRGVGRSGKDGN